MLGDAEAVEFTSLTAAERFTAVQTGAVDVLMRNSTWTQSRDTEVGMDFGPTTYYDGQQLMARSADGFTGSSSVNEIDGNRLHEREQPLRPTSQSLLRFSESTSLSPRLKTTTRLSTPSSQELVTSSPPTDQDSWVARLHRSQMLATG